MRQNTRKYIMIILGIALTAFGISIFYTPNKIVNGRGSGIATIFFYTLGVPTARSQHRLRPALPFSVPCGFCRLADTTAFPCFILAHLKTGVFCQSRIGYF